MALITMNVVSERTGTITSTAKTLVDYGFTQAEVDQSDVALITVEGDVRYRVDGTAPTASVGHIIRALIDTEVRGVNILSDLKMIRLGGADVVAIITLGKV